MKKLLIVLTLLALTGCSTSGRNVKVCFLEIEEVTTSLLKGNGSAGQSATTSDSW